MDAQKTIKKYILPNTMSTVSIILVVVALILAVIGITAMGGADDTSELFYPNDSETGTMAYIGVVGVSDWLYQNDDAVYYTAMDAEGYLYTVRLSSIQFKKLAPQFDYWMDESADAAAPAPVKLEGLVRDVPSDVRSSLAECWEITTVEYDQYFGSKLLDATSSTGEEAGAPWFFGALLLGLVGLVFLLVSGRSKRNAKKCLKVLEEKNLLERAAAQLENPVGQTVIGKNRGILTQDFLFGKGTGMVVAYSDMIWVYQQDRKRNFVPVNSYLMVGTMATAVEAAVDLNRTDKEGVISQAMVVISQRNPDAMIGYSKEFAKNFSAIRKGN